MRAAQTLVAWLIARPAQTVMGLALTLLLPFAQIFTGAAITVVVLAQDLGRALLFASAAALVVALVSLATGAGMSTILVNAALFWLPAALVAALLKKTRSLTLTLQVTAIVALTVTLATHLLLADPVAFWREQITQLAQAFTQMEFEQQAQMLLAQADMLAPWMTMLVVLTSWSLVALILVLGYWLYRSQPEAARSYGRFCDVNLGRFLAVTVALASVLAAMTGVNWLQNVALVGIVMFWIQGLALLHWLRVDGPLPVAMLVVVYALLPVFNVLLIGALAALGYSDAWLNFRARAGRRRQG